MAIRLHDVEADERRVRGVIVAADDDTVTVATDGATRTIEYRQVDRAKTVFEWGAQPTPGGSRKKAASPPNDPPSNPPINPPSSKEQVS